MHRFSVLLGMSLCVSDTGSVLQLNRGRSVILIQAALLGCRTRIVNSDRISRKEQERNSIIVTAQYLGFVFSFFICPSICLAVCLSLFFYSFSFSVPLSLPLSMPLSSPPLSLSRPLSLCLSHSLSLPSLDFIHLFLPLWLSPFPFHSPYL